MMGSIRTQEFNGAAAFWLRVIERIGIPAGVLGVLLYLMGWRFPDLAREQVDRILHTLREMDEKAEKREQHADQRQERAVTRVVDEILKHK